jgi:hypothetical protein
MVSGPPVAKTGAFNHTPAPNKAQLAKGHEMLALSPSIFLVLAAASVGPVTDDSHAAQNEAKNKQRCASFGFTAGTDAFANCVMQLSLKQEKQQPDRDTLVRRYRDRSMARRGDDRYPVCTAGMMENELDTSIGKWVGPNCQMAPD